MKTVAKALKVLRHLRPERNDWGVTELAIATGINKAVVHRLLKALSADRFVLQDVATKKYRLGPALIDIYGSTLTAPDIGEIARPHLAQLRDACGETVLLSVLRGTTVVVSVAIESPHVMRVSAASGNLAPLTASAAGKLFLAFAPLQLLGEVLKTPLHVYTNQTIASARSLQGELQKIRKCGWAVDKEEFVKGVRAVAAPVFGSSGGIEACIAIRAPASRLSLSRIEAAATKVKATAAAIAGELGYRPK